MPVTYLTDLQTAQRYGVHRSTPWRWARDKIEFPKPVRLSSRCTRWKLSELEAWESSRATGGLHS